MTFAAGDFPTGNGIGTVRMHAGEYVLDPEALAVADEIDEAIPGLPDLGQRRAEADRAQAHVRRVGEQLGALVVLARQGDSDAVLNAVEALPPGERAVLLATAVMVMAEVSPG